MLLHWRRREQSLHLYEPDAARVDLWQGLRERQAETKGMIQRFINYLDEDYLRSRDPEAHEQDGVRAISARPNAFLYVKDAKEPLDAAAVEKRFPGLAADCLLPVCQSAGLGLQPRLDPKSDGIGFDPAYMQQLFEYGYQRGRAGIHWQSTPAAPASSPPVARRSGSVR